jgi:hypothetical protein
LTPRYSPFGIVWCSGALELYSLVANHSASIDVSSPALWDIGASRFFHLTCVLTCVLTGDESGAIDLSECDPVEDLVDHVDWEHQQAASVSFYLLKGVMHFLPARSIHWEEGLYGSEIDVEETWLCLQPVVVLIMTVASRNVIAHLVWFYSFSFPYFWAIVTYLLPIG